MKKSPFNSNDLKKTNKDTLIRMLSHPLAIPTLFIGIVFLIYEPIKDY